MLAAARQRFLDDYIKIRHAEGRGSQDAAYYLALPFRDLTGRLQDQWTIRAKSYRYLERRVLPAIEQRHARPLRIADLGAGNCWLSYRLALRGHRPVAIDILNDPLDGLAAGRHYQEKAAFARVNAEFDDLPFTAGSLDLAIYNASIHYSTDYRRTLGEIRRVLGPGGAFLIVDSPVYQRREHGEMMVRERHRQFEKTYGFASDTLAEHRVLRPRDALRTGPRSGDFVEDLSPVVWLAMGDAAVEGAMARQASALELLDFGREVRVVILLFHPRSTKLSTEGRDALRDILVRRLPRTVEGRETPLGICVRCLPRAVEGREALRDIRVRRQPSGVGPTRRILAGRFAS